MFILKSKRRKVWGERQEIHVKDDWTHLTEAERVRRAMQMLDMAEEIVNRPVIIEPRASSTTPPMATSWSTPSAASASNSKKLRLMTRPSPQAASDAEIGPNPL
jgi:hypothetical protein